MRKGADKLRMAMGAKQQGRLDGFFAVQPKAGDEHKRKASAACTRDRARRAEGLCQATDGDGGKSAKRGKAVKGAGTKKAGEKKAR